MLSRTIKIMQGVKDGNEIEIEISRIGQEVL